jgi:hypothetical protein
MLQQSQNIQQIKASDIMSKSPKVINENELAVKALE